MKILIGPIQNANNKWTITSKELNLSFMDIILFGHSLTFDIMKMDQKKRKRKENQAI